MLVWGQGPCSVQSPMQALTCIHAATPVPAGLGHSTGLGVHDFGCLKSYPGAMQPISLLGSSDLSHRGTGLWG